MRTATKRSILAGALAAGFILASPLAASAAAPAHVPSITQYEGAPIPSTIEDLTLLATIKNTTPVYGEPASTLNFVTPDGWVPAGVRVSAPFTASSETWVAVEFPADSRGRTALASAFADAGVGYIRKGSVEYTKAKPADSAGAYPTKVSELNMTAYVGGWNEPHDLYLTPSLETSQKATGKNSRTDEKAVHKFEYSSDFFQFSGHKWIAVQTAAVPAGIAYICADSGFFTIKPGYGSVTPNPIQPTDQPTAAGPSAVAAAPSAAPAPSVAPAAPVETDDFEAAAQSNFFTDAWGKLLSALPAIVLSLLVMAATLTIAKPRSAEA